MPEDRAAPPPPARAARVLAVLASLHLAYLITFVWLGVGRFPPGAAGRALQTYGNLSGASRDYSFFAPNVASEVKAAFFVEGAAGGPSKLVTFDSDNREIVFRYACILKAGMQDPRVRDLFAQSWAALVLGSQPDAERVTVIVHRKDLPGMDEYRQGRRPAWKLIYAGEFGWR
jgi:hypothetical protein